jgi:spore germination protein GerM
MKGLALSAATLALAFAGCGDRGSQASGSNSGAGTTQATSSDQSVAHETPAAGTYEVWFGGDEGFLVVSDRKATTAPVTARFALNRLLDGLSDEEAAAGLFTAVPAGTELLGMHIEDGIATVDLSSAFEQGSGSLAESLRLAQVVYTLTQFDTIEGVSFRLEGEPVELFGGHGIILDRPQARQDFDQFLRA